MNTRRNFSIMERLYSFRFALRGLYDLCKDQHNFRIHISALVIVITAGLLLDISTSAWFAVLIVSAMVLACEAFNTSLEHLADSISEENSEQIRKAKDAAAAAVLISSIAALITGFIVFIPYLLRLIK